MIGSTKLTAVLGSGVDSTDPEAVKMFVREACRAGLALMLIAPGSKAPADCRTLTQRRKDDKAAQEEAKLAGRADWARVKSPSGLALATTNPATVIKYLTEYRKRFGEDVAVNFAIELGQSQLIVVDTDTAEQTAAFLEHSGAPEGTPPTVVTPGSQDENGEWAHSDGGHFYFTLPEGHELPTNMGSITSATGGYAILWHRRYVLIPPSTRPEGQYRILGREYEAPDWLLDEIAERSQQRADAATRRAAETADDDSLTTAIDQWAEANSWESVFHRDPI